MINKTIILGMSILCFPQEEQVLPDEMLLNSLVHDWVGRCR